MRIKTRLATFVLLGVSVAVSAPSVAQAAVAPSTHVAAQAAPARTPVGLVSVSGAHPGVNVSAAARGAVAPNIWETVCNTYPNSLYIYMHNSLGCVEFTQ